MTISLQSTITKPSPCKSQGKTGDPKELKSLFENILKQKKEYEKAQVNWVDDETVEVKNISNQALHWFLLQAEEQGMDISFTKQTVIKIG